MIQYKVYSYIYVTWSIICILHYTVKVILYFLILQQAGQVYGVPLSGPLVTKAGAFPEQRASNEDSRRKWIEVYDHFC